MILSILKAIVIVISAIFHITLQIVQKLVNVITDGAAQAKEATPSTIAALKTEAKITKAKATPLANKFESDVRKIFKVPTRTKVRTSQPRPERVRAEIVT